MTGASPDNSPQGRAGDEGSASDGSHARSSDPQGSELGRCESCGREDEDVVAVHRVYVTPETWDTEGKVDVVDEVEQWCFVCRSHYPHQEVD